MTRNKKGFTLVELVIVIAVIAILAGVMIAVFSGVVKRANESAELQKVKNEEIAQKADDILKKIDNANWFSWEDFENSLAAKLTEVYKANAGTPTTTEQLKAVVEDAITTYYANNKVEATQLTEAQVKAIVENAIASASLGGVTENQVRTIVNTAVAGISTVSKTDVQRIVDAAVAKGLTAADVAAAVAQLATGAQVQNVIDTLGTVAKVSDVEALKTYIDGLKDAMVTVSEDQKDVITAKALNIAFVNAQVVDAPHPTAVFAATSKFGLTADAVNANILWDNTNKEFIVVDGAKNVVYSTKRTLNTVPTDKVSLWTVSSTVSEDYSTYLKGYTGDATITTGLGLDVGETDTITKINYTNAGAAQTVVIRTNDTVFKTELNIDAPNDTVLHYGNLSELEVIKVASASYHEYGKVLGKPVIKQGHLVVEEGAVVPQVSVEGATGEVKVTANAGTIVSVDAGSAAQTTVVTNSSNVFVSGLTQEKVSGNAVIAEQVNDETSLLNALEKGYAQLDGDVTINGNLTITGTVVIDLNGHTLVVNGLIFNNGDLTIDDSKDNGQKKVLNVVNDAVSAKTSTNVSTESSLSYTKDLQGTLKVDSIITSSNNSLTILNGSFVSELDYHKYYETDNVTDGLIYVAENANVVIYNGAFFSENLEDATETYAAAPVAVVSNRGNTTIYKGEFVTKYCRETYDPYFDGKAHTSNAGLYNKDRMNYSYYTISSYGGSITMSPKANEDLVVYAARGALSFNSGKAEVNGGKFYAYHYYAAYIAGSSGKVTGTIKGGEFNLIDGGHLAAQFALYIGNDNAGDGGKRQPANVIILDCVVNSDKKAINIANSTGSIVVYGGKYNKTINEDFIDTNNYTIVNEDGYYVVKAK